MVWVQLGGTLGVIRVVPLGHFGVTLWATLGVLWDYFECTLRVVLGSLRVILEEPSGKFEVALGSF